MPLLTRYLAFAAALTLIGSVAEAKPRHKVARPVEEDDTEEAADDTADDDAADDDEPVARKVKTGHEKHAASTRHKRARQAHVEEAEEAEEDSDELVDAPVKVRKHAAERLRSWNVAIGPNVWAASVDASVGVGDKSIGTAIDFFTLQRHTRYGVPMILEARYKRFSVVGDMLYGVVDVAGAKEVGPLMVTLDGTVKSLLVDGIAGYRVLGDESSIVSLEARGGVRYQRTTISGSVGVSGNGYSPAALVNQGADALAGARVYLRPTERFYFGGAVDHSLFGSSINTWSASIDANLRITSRALLAAGWRTLTQEAAPVSTVMHGPKVSLELLF